MIVFTSGNIIKSSSEALVNTVNTQGVMGKGIALAFKNTFPKNFKEYEAACKNCSIEIGKLFITETGELTPKYIINFPTKKHWRNPSKIEYIKKGLEDLIRIISDYKISSVAIPPLGSGNGKLNWNDVKLLLLNHLKPLENVIDIQIYEPGFNDQTIPVQTNINLTPSRAILLHVLNKYLVLGYDINLLVIQKIAYFIQRSGEQLNLKFEKGYYGPYADNLNHVLKRINGTYISYKQNNTNPGTKVNLINDRINEIESYYQENVNEIQKKRVENILKFIEGFETPYGLELLGTIDFVFHQTGKSNLSEIRDEIDNWTNRKKEIIQAYHIEVALKRLKEFNLITK